MASTAATDNRALLEAIMNLSRYHRQHEEFYASSPREQAIRLQRHARTLQALADRWSESDGSSPRAVLSPFEGAEDLNSPVALQLDGVLFMEGEGRPAELSHLIRELNQVAHDQAQTGEWLSNAMAASWEVAASLVEIDELADLLGERHRIIANDWQASQLSLLIARLLERAADIVDGIDLTPTGLRADLAGPRGSIGRLFSAAELIARAADLCSESAGLVHENERRWRVFRSRVAKVVASLDR